MTCFQTCDLPIYPSPAAGRADLVRPLARAAIAAGADGLLVEVHPAPWEARSDGQQAISPGRLGEIAADLDALAALDGRRFVRPQRAGILPGSCS